MTNNERFILAQANCEALVRDVLSGQGLNLAPPVINYKVNTRATRRWGLCRCKRNENKAEIEISQRLLNCDDDFPLYNTLIHEILHAYFKGEGHKGKWRIYADYISMTTHYNITRTTNYKDYGIEPITTNRKMWACSCRECGTKFVRHRRFNVNDYRCGKCKGSLTGWIEIKPN